ncbi:MAG: amino acid transporter, partial [Gammaproteobacteria bacterium]
MTSVKNSGLGTLSTLSIGIGGMVGGGIFAVTGLTIHVTRGGAPLAFLIAGIVALLTSYSYLKLTLR